MPQQSPEKMYFSALVAIQSQSVNAVILKHAKAKPHLYKPPPFFLVLFRLLCMSYWISFLWASLSYEEREVSKKLKESISFKWDSNQQPIAPQTGALSRPNM